MEHSDRTTGPAQALADILDAYLIEDEKRQAELRAIQKRRYAERRSHEGA